MSFDEWKEEYKKHRENIRNKKKGLVDELSEIVSQTKKNIVEMGKIVAINQLNIFYHLVNTLRRCFNA